MRAGGGLVGFGEVDGGVGELGEHGVDRLRFGLAIVPVDGFDDLLARREDRVDVLVQNELQLLDRLEVGRVAA